MKKIRKSIFPVAGLVTRLLVATKAMPKELLTVIEDATEHAMTAFSAAG